MNNQDLKQIYAIRKVLQDSGYLDVERISYEIYDYSKQYNSISLKNILKDIKSEKPWEYINGETEFYGNTFKITKDTLIPRIETEDLVKTAIIEIKHYMPSFVIDVGTGSGCIILSLAKYFQNTDILFIGTDISKQALKVAEENKKLLKLNNVSFKEADLLKGVNCINRYCIVANLPYIPSSMYLKLDSSVKNYEPRLALDGGKDGLRIYEKLFRQIYKEKTKPSFLLLEFEPTTKRDLLRLLHLYFKNSSYILQKDFRDKERFLICFP